MAARKQPRSRPNVLPAIMLLAVLFFAGLLWDATTAFVTGGGRGGGDGGGLPPGGGSGGRQTETQTDNPIPVGGSRAPEPVIVIHRGTWNVVAGAGAVSVADDRSDVFVRGVSFSTDSEELFTIVANEVLPEAFGPVPLPVNVLLYDKFADVTVTQAGEAVSVADPVLTLDVPRYFIDQQAVAPATAVLYVFEGYFWTEAGSPTKTQSLTDEDGVAIVRFSFALPHFSLFSLGFKVAGPETCNENGICELSENAAQCSDCSTLLLCNAGETRCNGKVVEQCTQARQWKAQSICAEVCSAGACLGGKTTSGPIVLQPAGANTFYIFLGGIVIFLLFITVLLKYAFG